MSDYPSKPVSPEEARLWEEHTRLLMKLQDVEEEDYLCGTGWTAEEVKWAKMDLEENEKKLAKFNEPNE